MSAREETAVTQAGAGAARAPAPAAADRYVLLDRLGEGGMGVVWKAHDRVLDRAVALKLLHDRFLGAEDQQRLVAEARAMARLSHPNVVAVYDAGERDGRTYLTMELVRGEALSTWLRAPRRWQDIVAVFRDVARGVAAAHAAGIVHRDLKPANVLVGHDGRARVADFGIADDAAAPDPGLAAGVATILTAGVAGTPAYMAPERLRGEPADERADQFSYCVALYEALHGRRPFVGDTLAGLGDAIAAGPPAPVRPVPAWLHAVVRRGLAADPAARHPSMAALLATLERRPARWRRVALAGGAIALGGGAAILFAAGSAPAPCADLERHLRRFWNDDARARGEAAFAAEAPYGRATWRAVAAELDAYARAWTATRTDVCRASRVDGELAPDAARAQLACLEERRLALRGTVLQLLGGRPGLVDAAWRWVAELRPVEGCVEREAEAAAADPRIEAARALIDRGELTDADAELDAAGVALDGLRDYLREAAVSRTRSDVLAARGEPEAAAEELNRAWKVTVAARGPDALEVAELHLRRGALLLEVGRADEAADDAARAALLFERLGEGHPDLARARALAARAAGATP